MSGKTIPFSVRLSQEDAAFIATLEMRDTQTPSDKIRAIIGKARESAEREQSYQTMLKEMQDMVMPVMGILRAREKEKGEHSELLASVAEWLVEMNAYFMAVPQESAGKLDMRQFEEAVATRIFILFERMMRMGVTGSAPCYNTNLLKEKLAPVLELAHIINEKTEA